MHAINNTRIHRTLRLLAHLATLVLPVTVAAQQPTTPPAAQAGARGVLAGQVIDKTSARPLPGTNIIITGTQLRTVADLDGRFRLPVPVGVYVVRAVRLGNSPQELSNVRITPGTVTTIDFVLGAAVVQLQAQTVTATRAATSSDDALLATQRASSRVSDGISAEAIKRAPGANASDAVVRVTGVSIVDGRFAVVRGLAERYSNTLLNGVELPSPEPQKKVVPLDIFPSQLLESIVVSKTATPDKPGDFAGGSVEVSTKEFPNTRVMDASVSTGYNSVTTFRQFSVAPQRGLDFLGFDNGGIRQPPATLPAITASAAEREAFAESIRNMWTPQPTAVSPNYSAAMNVGGRLGGDNAPLGYVISANVNRETEATPNRFFQIIVDPSGLAETSSTLAQATTTVDLGGIANFALRLGASNKIGWKNLYTRNAEELVSNAISYSPLEGGDGSSRIYQVRYITRTLLQSQLTGDHLFNRLLGSRLEWKVTQAQARRDEPENRSLFYQKQQADSAYFLASSRYGTFWYRYLRDNVRSAQVDWTTPLASLLGDGALVKFGGLAKRRSRAFTATLYRTVVPLNNASLPWTRLAPERVFTPELLGPGLLGIDVLSAFALPYEADDDLTAGYVMLDLPIRSWLGAVGGVRYEAWHLDIYSLRKDTLPPTTIRRDKDLLPSINLTAKLSDRQNLRLAAYATVARPDPRELTRDSYEPVAGDCSTIGDIGIRRTSIVNADLRWERYPRAGELTALSAFAKNFTDPIVELIGTDAGKCVYRPQNATEARLRGVELEVRRGLTFLPGALRQLSAGVNVSVVRSEATILAGVTSKDVTPVVRSLRLQGQSDRLANLNVLYASADGRLEVSLLANYFSDRLARYGDVVVIGGKPQILPDTYERSRITLDAKARRRVGRTDITLSLRNLTDNERIFVQESPTGRRVVGYFRPGVGVSLGVGYALR